MKFGLPLLKLILQQLAKNVLIPSGWITVASAADAEIHNKNFRSGPPLNLAKRITTPTI